MKQRMPVLVRGVVYDDAHQAAEALGVAVASVYCQISRGDPDRIGLGRGSKRPGYKPSRSKPFTIGGVTYESMKAASLAIGMNPKYVEKIMRDPNPSAKRLQKMTGKFMALHSKLELAKRKEEG